MTPPAACPICSAKKALGRHFGGLCCSRCRAHFRRTVRFNLVFECKKAGSCEVNTNARSSCPACRYRRCLEAGLDPKLIQSDRKEHKPDKEKQSDGCSSVEAERVEEKPAEDDSCQLTLIPALGTEIVSSSEGPLGFRSGVKLPTGGDLPSLLRYYATVDKFVDEFIDSGYTHISSVSLADCSNHRLSLQEAFLSAPRRLSKRTKILWEPLHWVSEQYVTNIFHRAVLHYVDIVSHIPELRLLPADDQWRMVAFHVCTYGGLITAERSLRNTQKRCILTTGGTFHPLDPKEMAQMNDDGILFSHQVTNAWNSVVLEPLREANLSEEEFVFLRLLTFFTAVPKMSEEGREVVRKARLHYEQLFVQHLCSRLDRRAAVERMGEVMSILPMLEMGASIEINATLRALLFHSANYGGTFLNSYYTAASALGI
ncbi:hypothetical protein M3Y99_00463200 [Aphelenchoides fujianensis]|nr:hypothetical protein M3Y99_00463200 [Aphelenchoides fujianensis]